MHKSLSLQLNKFSQDEHTPGSHTPSRKGTLPGPSETSLWPFQSLSHPKENHSSRTSRTHTSRTSRTSRITFLGLTFSISCFERCVSEIVRLALSSYLFVCLFVFHWTLYFWDLSTLPRRVGVCNPSISGQFPLCEGSVTYSFWNRWAFGWFPL